MKTNPFHMIMARPSGTPAGIGRPAPTSPCDAVLITTLGTSPFRTVLSQLHDAILSFVVQSALVSRELFNVMLHGYTQIVPVSQSCKPERAYSCNLRFEYHSASHVLVNVFSDGHFSGSGTMGHTMISIFCEAFQKKPQSWLETLSFVDVGVITQYILHLIVECYTRNWKPGIQTKSLNSVTN